ncbi:hypothetical protein BDR03DRAFT_971562 [Suillus americanus]|nr:hypothetical protein BDR03DRAFT_971562 [Suillus americanus]
MRFSNVELPSPRYQVSLVVHFCLDPNTPWSISQHHIYKGFSFFEQRDRVINRS